MRLLALIPARGGSKGIPRKNLALIEGRSLIEWTIKPTLESACFDRVVVSTDDVEIAEVSQQLGAKVPFLRPPEISGDHAQAIDVITHALNFYSENGEHYDATVYLQPTSPFRSAAQIRESVRQYMVNLPDTLVSVVSAPHNMTPDSLMIPLSCEASVNLWLKSPHGQKMRRQEKSSFFARNGPAILIVSTPTVLKHRRLYGERVLGFEMDRVSSYDIDEPVDLEIARAICPIATKAQ